MKKIFVHCNLTHKQEVYLSKNFEIKLHDANDNILSPKHLIEKASGFDGIICQGNIISNKYIEKNENILKAISNVSVGYDNVDINYATEKKVAVFNTPNILDDTVADFTIGLILALTRKICEGNSFVKAGKWKKNSWPLFLGEDLKNELLGIIGMGNIGKKIALRAQSFGLKIIYHNRNKLKKNIERKYSANYSSLENLLNKSKYVLLALPLNAKTKHLINEKTLSMMRKDAYIVNIARGKIIKECDLVMALENNIIAGAALDVFEYEPEVNKKLLTMKNTVLMPHAGSASFTTRNAMIDLALKNINDFFLLGKCNNLVNNNLFKNGK